MAGPTDAEILEIGRSIHDALPAASRNPLKALDDEGDGPRLAGRRAARRAVPLRRRRARLPLPRRPRAPPHRLPRRGRRAARRRSTSRCGWAPAAPGARRSGAAAAAGVKHMAHRFIVGEDAAGRARHARAACGSDGVATSVDLLGEATVTPAEAERYAARCARRARRARRRLPPAGRRGPLLERDAAGPLPRANLSVKVSALTPLLRPDAPERGKRDAAARLRDAAAPRQASSARTCTSTWSRSTRARRSSSSCSSCSPRTSSATARRAGHRPAGLPARLARARSTRRRAWARATPRAHAARRPARQGRLLGPRDRRGRASTAGARRCSRSRPTPTATSRRSRGGCSTRARLVRVAIASHNLRSVAHAIAANRAAGAPDDDLELQVLRGLGDDLQARARRHGLRVRTYCPVGDLVAGMAYLVRRLLENTANESFLAAEHGGAAIEELLEPQLAVSSDHCPHPRDRPVPQRAGARAAPGVRARPAGRRAAASSTRACRCGCRSGSATTGATARSSSRPTRRRPTASSRPPRRDRGRGRRTPSPPRASALDAWSRTPRGRARRRCWSRAAR